MRGDIKGDRMMKFSLIHKLKGIFILALAVLFTNAVVSYSNIIKLCHHQQWVADNHLVTSHVEMLITTFKDAEIAQRHYLLTNNTDALKIYLGASEKIQNRIAILDSLTVNPKQHPQWLFRLKQKITAQQNLLQQEVTVSQQQGFAVAQQLVLSHQDQTLRLRQDIRELIDTVSPIQKSAVLQSQSISQATLATFSLTMMVNVLLLGFVYDLLRRYLSRLQQTEIALHESENRLRAIIDAEPECIKLIARDGKLLEINASGLAIMEVENADTLIGKPIDLNILPEYRDAFAALHQSVCQGNKGSLEFELEGFKGTRRWMETHAVPLINEADGTFLHLAVTRDITRRKQAEQKIHEQAALLDVATDAILVGNIHNQILFWNKGAERLYGWKVEEALGKNILELLHQGDCRQLEEALFTVISTGEWQGELHQLTKDGKQIIVESRWTLVRDEEGKPKSILSVNTNISQKKQLEARLMRSQRLETIGTLASGIVHDLNNILAPILMSVQLLQMKLHDQQMQKVLNTLEGNVKRGANLLKQVLSFARGIEGQKTIVQVKHLLQEIEQIVQQTFPKSIICSTDIADNLWYVSGDVTQLHQVLMNLVVNARDAMPDGGMLKISAENVVLASESDSYIVISIEDTGVGIPSNIQSQIFEPFFSTKAVGEGTGLGLSTAVSIINNHGGFISVESEVHKGSKFHLYLPAVVSNRMQSTAAVEMEPPTGHGEGILVVDDEAIIREITKSTLEAYNYRVLTAGDGLEAVSVYTQNQEQISLVLLDMMMPAMEGAIAIRQLKNINPDIKIIAMSGLLSAPQSTAIASMGIRAFLSKPCTAKELLQTIKTVHQHH
ncbi:PAS domain S-box protein [Anabaena sp. CA = ATCC 33047]|uniref:PAS domain S-box protein n=2 Tax=Anabaena sp. (strain CA / ATCC 33047) TaxID=52271 RepID=UPI0035117199